MSNKVDPTRPLYERQIEVNPQDMYAMVTRQALRFIFQSNRMAMNGWTNEDTQEAIANVRRTGFGAKLWSVALDKLKSLGATKRVDFGDFFHLGHEVKKEQESWSQTSACDDQDWRDREMRIRLQTQEHLKSQPAEGSKIISKYWMAIIRKQLKDGGQNMRLPWMS